MAAARVIHFGFDTCYRLRILRRAGYEVDECSNLVQFRSALQTGTDAVMVDDADGSVPLQAISFARSRTPAPIILFPDGRRTYNSDDFDLIVPSFTPPQEWLLDLAILIVRSQTIRAYSQLLNEQSERLRREAASLCEKSRNERQRSRELLKADTFSALPPKDPQSK